MFGDVDKGGHNMLENIEKELSLDEAIAILKKYQYCLETTLNIGHGTVQSAEVNDALKVLIKKYDEIPFL